MMPSVGRLRKRPDFLKVAAARTKSVTPGLILQARRRAPGEADEALPAADALRVGFTVTRKVGRATQRNRARRRLRAVAAEILPERGQPGTDYVLVGRQGTLERAYRELVADLRDALDNLARDKGRHPRRPGGPASNAGRRA